MTDPNDSIFTVPQTAAKGLTKREYFAAQALIGLASRYDFITASRVAVKYADQLITELNEPPKS